MNEDMNEDMNDSAAACVERLPLTFPPFRPLMER